jgi:exonuclease SbcC
LLESILFCLWGRARTSKEEVRTAGVGGDCVVEVEFEHEGHLYLVRRTLSGVNATARASAHCDGLAIAEGVRDTGRYLHQVLGMDDAAFRASVFAEQKQLAAFSDQSPAERRRLVLQLLGITPLDAARDAARKDAREAQGQHERLRAMLPDLELLRVGADDAAASAAAAVVSAETEEQAAAAARASLEKAEKGFRVLDQTRQEYDALVIEGRAARSQLDEAVASVGQLSEEEASLESASLSLSEMLPMAGGVDAVETRVSLVSDVVAGLRACSAVPVPSSEPVALDEGAVDAARASADRLRDELAGVSGRLSAVRAELERAEEQAARSSALSGAEDCPLCGQSLGDAFEKVQAHRAAEVDAASARLESLEASRGRLSSSASAAAAVLGEEVRRLSSCRLARQEWEQAVARRSAADAALAAARGAVAAGAPDLVGRVVDFGRASLLLEELRDELASRKNAASSVARLQGRLERRPVVAQQLTRARERVSEGEGVVERLREKVRALAFDRSALEAAVVARDAAVESRERAVRSAQSARLLAERAQAAADGEARRLADASAQHDALAALESDARHLGRLAELLNAFRTTVIATVGPRLAVQAASLFGELTDHEYDRLEVDPETYGLQICDAGRVYGLERFSGSEVDLANLALRVAISEHVRFQSGGSVGLLVLDEVFGPLDVERKARMLQAFERLRGRFRQILVVTHDADIKEELPNAIEVVKRPGRRATARLLHG